MQTINKIIKVTRFGGLINGNGYTLKEKRFLFKLYSNQIGDDEPLISSSDSANNEDVLANTSTVEPPNLKRSRSKPKAKAKSSSTSKDKIELENEEKNVLKNDLKSKVEIKIKKEKQSSDELVKNKRLTKKKKQVAKKSRLKEKAMEVLSLIDEIRNIEIPRNILNIAKTMRLSLSDVSIVEQKQCIDFFQKNSKMEILGALLMSPENENQVKFMRETLLTRPFMDILFRSLDSNLIDM